MAVPTERSPLLKPVSTYYSNSSSDSSSLSSESDIFSDIATQQIIDEDVEDIRPDGDDEDSKQALARQHVAKTISVLLMGMA